LFLNHYSDIQWKRRSKPRVGIAYQLTKTKTVLRAWRRGGFSSRRLVSSGLDFPRWKSAIPTQCQRKRFWLGGTIQVGFGDESSSLLVVTTQEQGLKEIQKRGLGIFNRRTRAYFLESHFSVWGTLPRRGLHLPSENPTSISRPLATRGSKSNR